MWWVWCRGQVGQSLFSSGRLSCGLMGPPTQPPEQLFTQFGDIVLGYAVDAVSPICTYLVLRRYSTEKGQLSPW